MNNIEDRVLPDYGPYSVCGFSNGVISYFGGEPLHEPLPLGQYFNGAERVVVFLVDGLGMINLKRLARKRDLGILGRSEWVELTSTFPSTTAAAVTTLMTGATPVEHGVIGYILYYKEFGVVAKAIEMTPVGGKRDSLLQMGMRPEKFLPVPTIFQRLTELGVKAYNATYSHFVNTGFNRMTAEGARHKGFHSLSDMCGAVIDTFNKESPPLFMMVYWGLVDTMGHRYGADGEVYQREASAVLRAIVEEVYPRLPSRTALVILSDHGQIHTSWREEIWWSHKDEIYKLLKIVPTGEQRMMYLHADDPEALKAYVEQNYADKCILLDSKESIKSGLLGKGEPYQLVWERAGDLILIATERNSFNFKYTGQEQSLYGRHGGLSPEEMLVPMIVLNKK